ncbi:hypothetical protein ACTSKR_03905 [Chitinibacteraceae bacterium HSL-7]
MRLVLPALLVLLPLSFAYAETSARCGGESGYYFTNDRKTNPRKGGFVADGAYVDENAFVAPTAAVCGSANVGHSVKVMGNAVVKDDATLSGRVVVQGNAVVQDQASVEGDVRITGNAVVGGSAVVSSGGVGDKRKPVMIKGWARIMSGNIVGGTHGSDVVPADVVQQRSNAEDVERANRNIRTVLEPLLNRTYVSMYKASDQSRSKQIRWPRSGRFELSNSKEGCRLRIEYEFSVPVDEEPDAYDMFQESGSVESSVDVLLKGKSLKFTYLPEREGTRHSIAEPRPEVLTVDFNPDRPVRYKGRSVRSFAFPMAYQPRETLHFIGVYKKIYQEFESISKGCGFEISQTGF